MRSPVGPYEILLVEDDVGDAKLAQIALRDAGSQCHVRHVRDGVEAIEMLRDAVAKGDRLPDLVLLDLNMPRMDGRQVLREMRADPALRMVPVVVLTTSAVDRDVAASYSLGANSFITKPMDMDEFAAVMRGIENYWFSVVRLPG
ncbi:MAG TPA: response regulator [Azospirillaceae bacterium]|nr:response regulator [Azospirillaceae bacterium]HRQ79829.1 response regulator [Azospirillaceae bacterium]